MKMQIVMKNLPVPHNYRSEREGLNSDYTKEAEYGHYRFDLIICFCA